MSAGERWYGWVKLFGRWLRLTGPHPDVASAHHALDAEIARRRIDVAQRWRVVTTGAEPRF